MYSHGALLWRAGMLCARKALLSAMPKIGTIFEHIPCVFFVLHLITGAVYKSFPFFLLLENIESAKRISS